MKIMIMSDVVPAASAKNEYTDGAIEKLLSDGFREKLHGAEFNIVNLECPLTRENEPAAKWGSSLKALPESMEALQKIPGLVVNLANNHIRDYGRHHSGIGRTWYSISWSRKRYGEFQQKPYFREKTP